VTTWQEKSFTMADTTSPSPIPTELISAQVAQEIAEEYLLLNVGDLLSVGIPRPGQRECWEFPIELSNASGASWGKIGVIAVDATTGEVRFSEEDARKVKDRAQSLARTEAPSPRA
jgi:hypothetical protein